ncbi:hypothetical protein B0A49_05973 [Cryomyces minteri]|uniref:GTPase-activating protein GYP5 n=1 Tax=Cryomyces minteri TaxID=331657 RepID=A0A4U0WMV4_9PEZI|nr:hypothetical protein B0A49_05973 [Cryomyces minteri]
MDKARSNSTPGPIKSPMFKPDLPPGTASGMAAGPATEGVTSVDWDLWQSVVYEGPAAVARTSADELGRSIASGIPQAIRGVVWQVLAQSKNEELEGVYRELVARGTDKERSASNAGISAPRSESSGALGQERDSLASSASSVHSDSSTPATSGVTSSPQNEGNSVEAAAKVNTQAERVKRAEDDASALQKLEKTIRRDLGARTSYSKYVMSAGLQEGLFGVCKAYALFDGDVGYAQGMNFIAMPLLFNMPEEEAFCMLVRLMNKYGLRDLFVQDIPGLHLHFYQFERLLEDFEPALYCHLHRRGVNPQLYATQWFLTLFAYRFPLQLVLRVYDLILSEGLESAILKFGIVLMQKNAQTLLGMKDMTQLTTFLKERLFDVYIDKAPSATSLLESGFFGSTAGVDKEIYRADMLVRDACAVKVTPDTLKAYAAEWAEQQRLTHDRDAELDALRTANAALTQKVRHLEERAEKHDIEHVALASELVRTKVDNEALQDGNESLRGQVEELRKVVEGQPAEVEARLREEMERIMQRNIEVQNENRALEEGTEEMERELVATKMLYAQTNAEHDALKQRWTNILTLMSAP